MVFFIEIVEDSLIGTISRIFREEFKKNSDLTIYLACIFFVYCELKKSLIFIHCTLIIINSMKF